MGRLARPRFRKPLLLFPETLSSLLLPFFYIYGILYVLFIYRPTLPAHLIPGAVLSKTQNTFAKISRPFERNQWFDTEGRAYIYYSLEDIMDALGCSNKKAISIMKELDIEAGIGLIEKKRQGQGKPTMIYLKQFMIQDVQKCNNYTSGEKSVISEVKNLHVLKCKNVMSRSEEFTHPEVKKLHTNKNNINNTELSNTESNHIISENDGMGFDVAAYSEIIKENIELDILLERYPYDRELLTGIFDLILETVLCKNKSIVVASSEYPAELVRSKFLKLNMFHVEYAMDCMRKNTSKIYNIKKYLLAALFNAPSTISGYYQAEVNHDLPQYAANDK